MYCFLRDMQINTDLRMMPERKDVKFTSTIIRLLITIFFTIGTFFVINYYWPRELVMHPFYRISYLVNQVDVYQSLIISIGFILVLFLSIFMIVFASQKSWDWYKSRRKSAWIHINIFQTDWLMLHNFNVLLDGFFVQP